MTRYNDPADWTDAVCPNGFQPFLPDTLQLTPCFQQICLLLPIHILLAVVSGYRIGTLWTESTMSRPSLQRVLMHTRMTSVLLLMITPPAQLTYEMMFQRSWTWPWISILVGASQMIAFIVHFVYLRTLIKRRGRHQGSLSMIALYIMLTVVHAFEITQKSLSTCWPFPVVQVLLLIIYGSTLIPNGSSTSTTENDTASLLSHSSSNTFYNLTLGHAQDSGNFLSRCTFFWVHPLIAKGYQGHLNGVDDLFQLPDCLNIARLAATIREAIDKTPTLFWALHQAHGIEFYSIGLLELLSDISGFAGPLLLNALLLHTQDVAREPLEMFDATPYWYALALFSTNLVSAVSSTHFVWRQSLLKAKIFVSLTTAIYGKSLEARSLDGAKPEILNLMSTDAETITMACFCFHKLWSTTFQIIVSIYLLYNQLGLASLAGLALIVALLPLNQWIVSTLNHFNKQVLSQKDERVALCSEAMGSVKNIKLHAWEDVFIGKILGYREKELNCLRRQKYFEAVIMYMWKTSKVLMSMLTFGISVLTGHPMTAATTFTTVALLNMLIGPLNSIPWVLSGLSSAWVSLKRIQDFLDLPSINLQEYYTDIHNVYQLESEGNPIVFFLRNASFSVEKKLSRSDDDVVDFILKKVNVTITKGELVCIEGPTAGGKTSLFAALLAKLQHEEGIIYSKSTNDGFGYVAQTSWLQRGTIRDNIVWGAQFNETRYHKVLEACALTQDLRVLGGDHTGVGEGGNTLSGGQRARVSLARAVYQDKDTYLLDDVLSALDAHVARHVVNHCLLGLLRHKTRIIISEHRQVLAYADQILHVENGFVTPSTVEREPKTNFSVEQCSDASSRPFSDATFKSAMLAEDDIDEDILNEESKEYGTLSWDVFYTYAKATGIRLAMLCILLVVLQTVSEKLGDVWLAQWVELHNASNTVLLTQESILPTDVFHLQVFAGLATFNSIVVLSLSFAFAYAGLRASKLIHQRMLTSVFGTRFQFFDLTPLGRLLNRFNSDMFTIDSSLPQMISFLFSQATALFAALLISVYALPWMALLVLPLVPAYIYIQNRYRYSSRDVKRLSSNTLSPLYAQFTETLQGLTTIRAMKASDRFQQDFRSKLSDNIRAKLSLYASENWLLIRMQFLGSLVVGAGGLVAAVTASPALSPGMVGLAISYALSITELTEFMIYAVSRTEQELIAVERVSEYCELEPEVNSNGQFGVVVAADWPVTGVVQYANASLKYRANLDPSLNEIYLDVKHGQAVGIAGRTGAGKSSLLAAILRVVPLSSGSIFVDGQDISVIPITVLRDRIAVVPQQPLLFAGTIRENLDPRGDHPDSRIWHVLDKCLAKSFITTMGGLGAKLDTNGGNLSAGQKQLICLARALLKNAKIVCIDEGTANLDYESERVVQLVLQEAFRDTTVLQIAHRISSLQNSDRVIIMNEGRVVEDGPSSELISITTSLFYQMLRQQNISL